MAGVPQSIVHQAKQFLQEMETGQSLPAPDKKQDDMFTEKHSLPKDPVLEELANIDPDELSPKAALGTLYKLKSSLQKID